MSELVSLKIENHIADVRLNREDKLNALNESMFEEIAKTIDRLRAETEVRVVVLSGQGAHFCAGADVDSLQLASTKDGSTNKTESLMDRYHNEDGNIYQYVGYGWKELKVPVIAVLKGVAFGGGCQIALGADLRFASSSAQLSTMEVKWGLIPDMGISQTLPGIVKEDIARELIYTGRVVDADEALELGLVTRICEDPYREALNTAKEIASKNPDSIRAAKTLINRTWRSNDVKQGLLLESELQEKISGKPNQLEAIMAQLQKRPPKFVDS